MFVKVHEDLPSPVSSSYKKRKSRLTRCKQCVCLPGWVFKKVPPWCSGSRWNCGSSRNFCTPACLHSLCLLQIQVRAIQLEHLSAITVAHLMLQLDKLLHFVFVFQPSRVVKLQEILIWPLLRSLQLDIFCLAKIRKYYRGFKVEFYAEK